MGCEGHHGVISDQPASARPPSAAPVEPPAPAKIAAKANELPSAQVAPSRSRTDHALDLWSTTDKTEQQIAEEVGCALGSVKAFVSSARKKNDPRAFARKLPHDEKLSQPPAPKPQPVLISRKDEEREPPVAGFAKPVERKPFKDDGGPALIGIGPRPDANIAEARVVGIDPIGNVIRGPITDWTTDAPTMRTIRAMNHPDCLFDRGTLIEAGPWPGNDAFSRRVPMIQRHLAAIGIDFVDLKGAGCRIRVAGT